MTLFFFFSYIYYTLLKDENLKMLEGRKLKNCAKKETELKKCTQLNYCELFFYVYIFYCY